MPARIVVVHDDPVILGELASALRGAGHDLATFQDPMVALVALEASATVELLIARDAYPTGKPNGVALALMARRKRPGMKVLFIGEAQHRDHAADIGTFMALPVTVPDVLAAVGRLLG